MKTTNKITRLIAVIMTVAALIAATIPGGGLVRPVKAQTSDGSVKFVSYASVGIVHGQKIRLSVTNTKESGGNLSLSFSYYLAHGTNSSGVPLYESESIKIPAGEFRSHDVSREDLKSEGEAETGRAQLLMRLTMIAPAGSDADDFPASLEIIEDEVQAGGTVNTDSKYRLIILAAKRSKQLNAPFGFLPGHKIRYTLYYPKEEGEQRVGVTTYTYDSYGNLLHQTNPATLEPGDSVVFDVNRDDLRVPGEDNTGRLQVASGIQAAFMDGSVRTIKLSVSMELVDSTGRTKDIPPGGDYYTGTVSVSGDGF